LDVCSRYQYCHRPLPGCHELGETIKNFKVILETAILDLIEGTHVAADADPGEGEFAAKVMVSPPAAREPA
jgi:hypothetical protein